jgi:hypothetical protein
MSNSQKRKVSQTQHKRNRRIFFNNKKINLGCQFVLFNLFGHKVRCGYKVDPFYLDWHHLIPNEKFRCNSGKRISVAEMISRGMSKEVIEKELKKCVVLCKKHHAEVEMKKGEEDGGQFN